MRIIYIKWFLPGGLTDLGQGDDHMDSTAFNVNMKMALEMAYSFWLIIKLLCILLDFAVV